MQRRAARTRKETTAEEVDSWEIVPSAREPRKNGGCRPARPLMRISWRSPPPLTPAVRACLNVLSCTGEAAPLRNEQPKQVAHDVHPWHLQRSCARARCRDPRLVINYQCLTVARHSHPSSFPSTQSTPTSIGRPPRQ